MSKKDITFRKYIKPHINQEERMMKNTSRYIKEQHIIDEETMQRNTEEAKRNKTYWKPLI